MRLKVGLLILMMVLFSATAIGVEPTQQFNKIFLDPLYRQEMEPDTDYRYNITIDPPDGLSSTISAIVTFQVWLNPTIEFCLTVNGQSCNTPSFEVHTTYAGAGEGNIFFDCSNIMTSPGTYEIILTPDDDTGAVSGWLDLTYMNKPRGEMEVFGTEYQIYDEGTTFIQLLDGDTPINNATCFADIYYPDKSLLIDSAVMTYQADSNGLYYHDLTMPNITGVYMIDVLCQYQTISHTHAFEEYEITEGVYVSGTAESMNVSDDAKLVFKETSLPCSDSSYTFYGNQDVDHTSYVLTKDDNLTIDEQLEEGQAQYWTKINFTCPIYNGTELNFWLNPDADNKELAIIKANDPSTEYAVHSTFTKEVYQWINLTLTNIPENGTTEVWLSDNGGAGSFVIWFDYLEVVNSVIPQDGNVTIDINFSVNSLEEIHDSLMLGIEYTWSDSDPLNINIYNFTSGKFQQILQLNYAGSDAIDTVMLSGLDDFIQNNNTMILRINDTILNESVADTFEIDHLYLLDTEFLDSPISLIRGGGEIHVTDRGFGLLGQIWSLLNQVWEYITINITNTLNEINETTQATQNNTEHIIQQIDDLNFDLNLSTDDLRDIINSMNQNVSNIYEVVQDDLSLKVSGTDYAPGDNGRMFLQLTANKTGVNDAFCQASIHYPDSIQGSPHYFIQDGFMSNMGVEGIYYLDYTVPNDIGIYVAHAECFIGTNTSTAYAYADNLLEGNLQSGTLNDTLEDDGNHYYIKEQINTGSNRSYQHDFYFDLTGFPNATNLTQREAVIAIKGRLNPLDAESITVMAYNFTGGYFHEFDNIWFSQGTTVDTIITNGGEQGQAGDFRNASNIAWVRLQDNLQSADTTTSEIRIDEIFIATTTRQAESVTIQGGVELNVRENLQSTLNITTSNIQDNVTEILQNQQDRVSMAIIS